MREEPGATRAGGAPRVVVGVDGSVGADRALVEAVRQARLHRATLEVYSYWHLPSLSGYPATFNYRDFADVSQDILDRALGRVARLDPLLEVRGVVEEGSPARGLVRASKGATLVVVGSRGLGGFTGALLGSVSRYCIEHASCPVLVVRPPERHSDDHSDDTATDEDAIADDAADPAEVGA